MNITRQDRTLVIERVFDVPRDLVFEAWSKPEHLARWWAVKGWTVPVCDVDFRPGGTWRYCMKGPKGEESWGKAIYHEIVPPERIVFTDYFADADGNVNEKAPSARITVEFTEHAGRTTLRTRSEYPSSADLDTVMKMGMAEGVTESWDTLEDLLASLNAQPQS